MTKLELINKLQQLNILQPSSKSPTGLVASTTAHNAIFKNPDIVPHIIQHTSFLTSPETEAKAIMRLRCRALAEGLTDNPKCENLQCTNKTKFEFESGKMRNKWKRFCGSVCAAKDPSTVAKKEATMMKRYGVKNAIQKLEIKEKAIQTNLKKYGVENPQQNKKINAKTQATKRRVPK